MSDNLLFDRWVPLAEVKAREFATTYNLDPDDTKQAAYIGLVEASRSYDEESGVQFNTFATHCITNALLNYVTRHNRQTENFDTSSEADTLPDTGWDNAEDRMILNDTMQEIVEACGEMTDREEDVLLCRMLSDDPETLQSMADRWETSRTSIIRDEERLREKIKENYTYGKGYERNLR